MKVFTSILVLTFIVNHSHAQNINKIFTVGIEFRQESIDIEDVPRGPLPRSYYGDLTGTNFWQALSVFGKFGLESKRRWQYSLAFYSRYNHNHHTEDPYKPSGPTSATYDKYTPDVKRIKFDLFLDAGKMFHIHRKKQRYLTCFGGLGFTNINSRTDFYYQPLIPPGGASVQYKGSFFDFGPRIGLGYQQKRVNASLVGYFIEDAAQTNLTALWMGVLVSYELKVK